MVEPVAVCHQVARQFGQEPGRVIERLEIGDLAADVHVDARDPEAIERCGPGIDRPRPRDRHTELVVEPACRDLCMCPGIDIGVDAEGHRRTPAH